MNNRAFLNLAGFATVLTFCVVVLGAWVRLGDAGLGCPDWPGCYGHLIVPEAHHDVAAANEAFPHRPVEAAKGWKEMIHRYFAGTLGLCVFALGVLAYRNRRDPTQLIGVPFLLCVLIVFQAALGMWTVTLLLKPLIVTAHLLGGMATLALLAWTWLRQSKKFSEAQNRYHGIRNYAFLCLAVLVFQIALGGWTSTNYAALACTDFPTCQGGWIPPSTDFKEAFTLWHGLGINYEFGILDNAARATIHWVHRVGALVTWCLSMVLAGLLVFVTKETLLRKSGILLALVLSGQFALGIANVKLSLPLPVAVAHNAGAALLLLTLLLVSHMLHAPTHSKD